MLTYALLGTSRHLSLGIYAIISLMTKDVIDKLEGKLYPTNDEILPFNSSLLNSSTLINPNYLSNDVMQAKVMIGMALSFFSGVIQVNFFKIFKPKKHIKNI